MGWIGWLIDMLCYFSFFFFFFLFLFLFLWKGKERNAKTGFDVRATEPREKRG